MTFLIPFPAIDPILFELGPIAVRWYGLAYLAGLLGGWRYLVWLGARSNNVATPAQIDDFLVWATVGVVLGGRLGYVLFYRPDFYFANPSEILKVWQGGMSFHGGLLGVLLLGWAFVRKRGIGGLAFADMVACVAPIGIFFGRIANFINGELFGRPTDVPWAMVFPGGGVVPRHPSQLYEAALEGLVLGLILHLLWRNPAIRARTGLMTGIFLLGYGMARTFVELFRQPDSYLGFVMGGMTQGQLLSIPVGALGLYLVWHAFAQKPAKH